MITVDAARKLALSLPHVEEKPHFQMPSFRLRGKIIMTLQPELNRAMVRLPAVEQSVFILSESFFPVPGTWGKQGATYVNLKKVGKQQLKDALEVSWRMVAPAKVKAAHPEISQAT